MKYIPHAIKRELLKYLENLIISYYYLKCGLSEECIRENLMKIRDAIPIEISDELSIDMNLIRDVVRKEIISTAELIYGRDIIEKLKKALQ